MPVVRKTISMPPALAARLEEAARAQRKTVSEVVVSTLEKGLPPKNRSKLPFDYAFDGPEDMSETADETLRATWITAIERHR